MNTWIYILLGGLGGIVLAFFYMFAWSAISKYITDRDKIVRGASMMTAYYAAKFGEVTAERMLWEMKTNEQLRQKIDAVLSSKEKWGIEVEKK